MAVDIRRASNVVALLREHAATAATRAAVCHVADPSSGNSGAVLTYEQLDREARRVACWLRERCPAGTRVLLAYPTGAQFAAALLGCWYAGAVAVPVPLPDRYTHQRRRLTGVARNCEADAVLTDAGHLADVAAWVAGDLPGARCEATDRPELADPDGWTMPRLSADTTALLQYTSGSTGSPKGVMISHANLLDNGHHVLRLFGVQEPVRMGGWLPLYHDLGLAQLLLPLYLGGTSVLMDPVTFLKRPHRWLSMIDEYDLVMSGGPNFAYERCCDRVTDEQIAQLDLSRWRVAINGAEPVRAATLTRFAKRFAPAGFRSDAMAPGFGMAEATLLVAASAGREPVVRTVDAAALQANRLAPAIPDRPSRTLVSCGSPLGIEVQVVDPSTRRPVTDGQVGEIWLRGASVTRGYWGDEQETARACRARTADDTGQYLRTGDLGAIDDGELFITGRLKETIVIRGRNLYPHDIEAEVRAHHSELGEVGAAFTVTGGDTEELLVLTHEIRGRPSREALAALATAITRTVWRCFGLRVDGLLLLRPGAVRRTTSGKVERAAMRGLLRDGGLEPLHQEVSDELAAVLAERTAVHRDASLARLDRTIRSHQQPGGAFAAATLAELDRREQFPEAACAVLDDAGMARHYVPARYDGALTDFAESMRLLRRVAREDLTVAVAHGKTFLGAAPVWVAGSDAQARWLAAQVRPGAVVSWGLTERHHGSDLLAGEVTATRVGDTWRLDGEKWPINNATRGRMCCVLARTDPAGGPRGFSLFLVDKQRLDPGMYRHLPKAATHGIRGADISGIAYEGARLDASALVGPVGSGVETVLKTLQLTRTVCAALSLGAGDRALELAGAFVAGRRQRGRALLELPQVRRMLGEAHAGLLLADATSTVAGRAVTALPAELSVVSAVAKAFAPTVVQQALDQFAELMGLRAFLADGHADGAFAKLERDHRIVAIFDGSTVVNRHALITQFPRLGRAFLDGRCDTDGLVRASTLGEPAGSFDPGKLRLVSPSGASVVNGVPELVARLADADPDDGLAPLARRFEAAVRALHQELVTTHAGPRNAPPSAFHLAERYEWCFAGAACLHLWARNASPGADRTWLRACLALVLIRLGEPVAPTERGAFVELADRWVPTWPDRGQGAEPSSTPTPERDLASHLYEGNEAG